MSVRVVWAAAALVVGLSPLVEAEDRQTERQVGVGDFANHPVNVWVRQSPADGRPPAMNLTYEGGGAYDPYAKKWIHHGGHEGIPQTERTVTYDLQTGRWEQRFPNTSPPGACCLNNNGPAFDSANRRLVRFPAGSLGHGFQFSRSIYLKNAPTSVWTYDSADNTWLPMRPPPYGPAPKGTRDWVVGGLCHQSAYDSLHEVIVHLPNNGLETIVYTYDVYANCLDMFKAKGAPSARGACGMAFDPKNDRLVVFGSGTGNDEKTWLFDLKTGAWKGLELDPHPPAKMEGQQYSTHPVMAYDPLNGVFLCVIWHPQTGTHETWSLDTDPVPKWTRLNPPAEPDKGGSRARNLGYSEEHNVFILELAQAGPTNQIWTYRYRQAPADKRPGPPTGPEVVTDAGKATLSWTPSPTPGVREYRVYRATAEKAWQTEYRLAGSTKETSFREAGPDPGKINFYRVSAVGADGLESRPSISARTQPRVLIKPVVSVLAKDRVEVRWRAHPAKDVVGCNVYRGLVTVKAVKKGTPAPWRDNDPEYPEPLVCHVTDITSITKLNDAPVAGESFTDAKLDLTTPGPESGDYRHAVYAYVLRAVNRLGTESGPSPYALTIPSEPVNIFVRNKEGGAWEARWDPNPEKGIAGYRICITAGQHAHNLLTPELVKQTRFEGKDRGKLWITAVDALGQEGQVSSPVNINPSYRAFFEGEWHQ